MSESPTTKNKPQLSASRRHFIVSAALLSSTVATNVLGMEEAQASHRRRRRRRRWRRSRKPVVCFLRGTRIGTPNGEVPIEQLKTGDLVNTSSGASRPIKWLARRLLERSPDDVWPNHQRPIKIAREAIDGQLPHRDLYVSAGHRMYLDGILIPVAQLVNGASITECASAEVETLEYFHIELEEHAVVFAEGAATETLMASPENRATFDNVNEYVELYGANDSVMVACAPVAAYWGVRGELLSRIRSMIAPVIDRRDARDIARDRLLLAAMQQQNNATCNQTNSRNR